MKHGGFGCSSTSSRVACINSRPEHTHTLQPFYSSRRPPTSRVRKSPRISFSSTLGERRKFHSSNNNNSATFCRRHVVFCPRSCHLHVGLYFRSSSLFICFIYPTFQLNLYLAMVFRHRYVDQFSFLQRFRKFVFHLDDANTRMDALFYTFSLLYCPVAALHRDHAAE